MNIGLLIKNERLKKNISGNKLSKIANISQSGLSAIERGEQDPTFYMIEKICSALNITVQELISNDNFLDEKLDIENHLLILRMAIEKDNLHYRNQELNESEKTFIKNSIDMILNSTKKIHSNFND